MAIEICSCNEVEFLRNALKSVRELCEDGTSVPTARFSIVEIASEALADPAPGGERPCSCPEALHLRRALRACFNVCQDTGSARKRDNNWFGLCDDLAQANNLADQGLKLEPLTGDPAVYTVTSFIPRA